MGSSSIVYPPFPKWSLRQGIITNYKSVAVRTLSADTDFISCTVPNYPDLVSYKWHSLTCSTTSGFKFRLEILKRPANHYFKLYCHLVDKTNFYVKYGEDEFSDAIPSKQTTDGYLVEAPKKVVCDSRNKYLHKGNTLVVRFYHADRSLITRRPFAANGRRTRRDEELFSRDMLKLYEMRNSTGDFYIDVLDERFLVHKFIFEARTVVNNPSCSRQVSVIGDPLVMDKVIKYMYSGLLEETDLTERLKILEIAVNLDMSSLVQTLKTILVTLLSIDNAWDVLEMALKLDLIDLVLQAQDCLSQYTTNSEKEQSEDEQS